MLTVKGTDEINTRNNAIPRMMLLFFNLKKAGKVVELGEGAIFSNKYLLFLFLGITFWL